VASIDGLLALHAAFRKQTYFDYFMYLSIFLFVENKFFFFFLSAYCNVIYCCLILSNTTGQRSVLIIYFLAWSEWYTEIACQPADI